MSNYDIPNSSPKSNDFRTNRIGGNPLEPKYSLPKVEVLPFTETKFIRDSIKIDVKKYSYRTFKELNQKNILYGKSETKLTAMILRVQKRKK